MSLSARIVLGLLLGVFTGLLIGPSAAILDPLGRIYIRLMQMTVLPYLVLALVLGFGQLEPARARRLGLRAVGLLLLVWGLLAVIVAVLPLALPRLESASFFSESLVEPRASFDVSELFFTSNPFHSLANSVVPAVVLFSSMLGIFLIGVEGRERVLEFLRPLNRSIERITMFVIGLTPYGVFAIAASAAGTMDPETWTRLEAYFVIFAAASLLLTFWLLPLLVTALTPFTYREVVGASRDALLTAFVASNAFMVLPMLVERSRVLLRRKGLLNEESGSAADVLIPILFNFPNAGKLLTLLFVPFAAWLAGEALEAAAYPRFLAVGIPSYFAKAQVAIPFLLDTLGLPHDLFHLYVPTAIVTGKLDSMVTAMNLFVFALLGAATMGGFLKLRRRRLMIASLSAAGGIVLTVVASGILLAQVVKPAYDRDEALRRMHLAQITTEAIVHLEAPLPGEEPTPGESVAGRVRERGTLRVGYDPGNLPFSFLNADSQLVGFDVELAHGLAAALGVVPEFVPVSWPDLPGMLERGTIDVMPGVWVRPYWFGSVRLSLPYLQGTVGLVVRDEDRHAFDTVEKLRRSRGLRIGVPLDSTQLAYSMKRYFEGSDAEFVVVESPAAWFSGERNDVDAFLVPAETGSAATLIHPRFTVVVPQPDPVGIPFAFGLALAADDLTDQVNEWVLFAESEGTIREAYEYWVLGRGAEPEGRRWSILGDILGWGIRGD